MVNKNKKEMLCYLAVFLVLVIIVILNNVFWKLGKIDNDKSNNIVYLESNNVIYNVPYEEQVLD